MDRSSQTQRCRSRRYIYTQQVWRFGHSYWCCNWIWKLRKHGQLDEQNQDHASNWIRSTRRVWSRKLGIQNAAQSRCHRTFGQCKNSGQGSWTESSRAWKSQATSTVRICNRRCWVNLGRRKRNYTTVLEWKARAQWCWNSICVYWLLCTAAGNRTNACGKVQKRSTVECP